MARIHRRVSNEEIETSYVFFSELAIQREGFVLPKRDVVYEALSSAFSKVTLPRRIENYFKNGGFWTYSGIEDLASIAADNLIIEVNSDTRYRVAISPDAARIILRDSLFTQEDKEGIRRLVREFLFELDERSSGKV